MSATSPRVTDVQANRWLEAIDFGSKAKKRQIAGRPVLIRWLRACTWPAVRIALGIGASLRSASAWVDGSAPTTGLAER
jgi:hypothetical protein